MRKLKYPEWTDWHQAIQLHLTEAMKHTGLASSRINGAETSKFIPVKSPDSTVSKMPYVQVIFSGEQDGWDGNNAGQQDYNTTNAVSSGTDHYMEQSVPINETITFALEGFTNKHSDAMVITQAIKSYFNIRGSVGIDWQNEVQYAYHKLHDFFLEAQEADDLGNIKYYRAGWLISLQIKSDILQVDRPVKAIGSINLDLEEDI